MAEDSINARLISEFVGTFFLIFTIGCNVLTNQTVWGGVSIASVLTVMIYALGSASGAHFNPAVSVALGVAKKENWDVVKKYVVTQLIAGFVASLLYCIFFWATIPLGPKPNFGILQAGIVELLYTFMLCFVVLNVAASKKDGGNQYYGIAIGFVIVAGAYGAGNISGGCFNPAVALALDASSVSSGFGYSLIYILFELLGALLAVGLFQVCRPEEKTDAMAPAEYAMPAKLMSEFIGTYMLVLTVGLNVITKSVAGAFSIAASLMCMIFALGSVSGAHFNPAVTTALVLRGNHPKKDSYAYVGAQCFGGIAAALSYSWITTEWSVALGPAEKYNPTHAFVAELVFTFVLAFVVLSVATVEKMDTQYVAFAIGSCVTVGGFAIGNVSGGSLNPAVSLGIATAHLFGGGGFINLILYVIAELLGGALAAVVFSQTRPSLMEKDLKAAKV